MGKHTLSFQQSLEESPVPKSYSIFRPASIQVNSAGGKCESEKEEGKSVTVARYCRECCQLWTCVPRLREVKTRLDKKEKERKKNILHNLDACSSRWLQMSGSMTGEILDPRLGVDTGNKPPSAIHCSLPIVPFRGVIHLPVADIFADSIFHRQLESKKFERHCGRIPLTCKTKCWKKMPRDGEFHGDDSAATCDSGIREDDAYALGHGSRGK
jgi:hypothetical protein